MPQRSSHALMKSFERLVMKKASSGRLRRDYEPLNTKLDRGETRMNFLEQIAGEWYYFNGYFVSTNVNFVPMPRGGFTGSIGVVTQRSGTVPCSPCGASLHPSSVNSCPASNLRPLASGCNSHRPLRPGCVCLSVSHLARLEARANDRGRLPSNWRSARRSDR